MKRAFFLGILSGVIAVILLIRFFPPGDDFHLDNPFWNGLKDFKEESGASPVNLKSAFRLMVSPSRSVLFIIGPSGSYTDREISLISGYLQGGGTLFLADDFGSANSILRGLRLKTRFTGHLVVDPLFRGKAQVFVKTVDFGGQLTQIESLMFNYPTSLQVASGEGKVLAFSSPFSFYDDNLNGKREKDETQGPFPMIAFISYKGGKIYLVSDSSLFINCMLNEGENKKLLQTVIKNKKVIVDVSHHPAGTLLKLKNAELMAYGFLSRLEVRYSVFLVLVICILLFGFKKKKVMLEEEIESIIESILGKHPTWSKDTLIKLKKELGK